MKNMILATVIPLTILGVPLAAQASTIGKTEDIVVKLNPTKLDITVPAMERFDMLNRLADHTCETSGRTATDFRIERECKAVFKRSILEQVGDEALKDIARKKGVL